jgi:hypothetical protein
MTGPDRLVSHRKDLSMLRLFGIRPNRVLVALAGAAALAVGLVIHGPVLMAAGAILVVYSAVMLIAGRRGSR